MDPHWSVRMGYVFMKIDSWGGEYAYLTVDSTRVNTATYDTSGS